jgi:hypothetical protein
MINGVRVRDSGVELSPPERISGPLDSGALTKTLNTIVRRHASLRTRFIFDTEDGYQIVDDEVEFQLPVLDMSSLPDADREPEALRLASDCDFARDLRNTKRCRNAERIVKHLGVIVRKELAKIKPPVTKDERHAIVAESIALAPSPIIKHGAPGEKDTCVTEWKD